MTHSSLSNNRFCFLHADCVFVWLWVEHSRNVVEVVQAKAKDGHEGLRWWPKHWAETRTSSTRSPGTLPHLPLLCLLCIWGLYYGSLYFYYKAENGHQPDKLGLHCCHSKHWTNWDWDCLILILNSQDAIYNCINNNNKKLGTSVIKDL